MTDEKKKTKEKSAPTSDTAAQSTSEDFSSILFSELNAKKSPLENKNVAAVVHKFTFEMRKNLANFLGCKVLFEFEGMTFRCVKDDEFAKSPCVLSGFFITSENQNGVLSYGFNFLNSIINLLYGGKADKKDAFLTLGKTSTKISERLTSLILTVLHHAFQEVKPLEFKGGITTDQVHVITNRYLPDYYFELRFKVNVQDCEGHINLILPEEIFEAITMEQDSNQPSLTVADEAQSHNRLHKDIIDSSITLIARLHDIKLKVSDVLDIKQGDLIPIHNPNEVFISHNEKHIFKGTAGQSNSMRVVKIEHTID